MEQQHPIGFWLTLVDGLMTEQFNNTVEEHGLTRRQWQIMNILVENPSTADGLDEALAPFFGPDTDSSSTEHVDELVESGWVSSDDENYLITELGRTSLAALAEVVEHTTEEVAAGVSEEDYAGTVDVLERMARNLGWTE